MREAPQPIEDKYADFMRDLGRMINDVAKELHGPDTGFFIAMFPFGVGGRFNYISNANREDIIKLLEEMIVKFKGS